MSLEIGHFAVGTSATLVMFHALPLRIRLKLRIAQVFIVMSGGLWAMLPDVAKFSNLLRNINNDYWMKVSLPRHIMLPDLTALINQVYAFHHSRWANIFFFHQLMDTIDKRDKPFVSGALVLGMVLVILAALARELLELRASKKKTI